MRSAICYVGTTTFGLGGLVLAVVAAMVAPGLINYYRFSTGKWKTISRNYRPSAHPGD